MRYSPAKDAVKEGHDPINSLTVMETVEQAKGLWKGMIYGLLYLI